MGRRTSNSPSLHSPPICPCASLTKVLGLSSGHRAQLQGVNTAQGVVPAWAIFGPEQQDKRPGGWSSDAEQDRPPPPTLHPRLLPCSWEHMSSPRFSFCSALGADWSPPFSPGHSLQLTSCFLLRAALGVQAIVQTQALPGLQALSLYGPGISPMLQPHPSILAPYRGQAHSGPKDGWPSSLVALCLYSLLLGGPAALSDSKPCSAAHAPSPRACHCLPCLFKTVPAVLKSPPWRRHAATALLKGPAH